MRHIEPGGFGSSDVGVPRRRDMRRLHHLNASRADQAQSGSARCHPDELPAAVLATDHGNDRSGRSGQPGVHVTRAQVSVVLTAPAWPTFMAVVGFANVHDCPWGI